MDSEINALIPQPEGQVYNFSAGPAPLPKAVLEQAKEELLNWNHLGTSVMEISHRGKDFIGLAEASEQDLRDLLVIPENYRVLFLQGGARGQFAAVPLNIKGNKTSADYVNSGYWAQSAIKEAQRYLTNVSVVADGKASGFTTMPDQSEWRLDSDAAYLHYTPNETIGGLAFPFIPDSGGVPLVADMSSTLLSEPLDVSRFGVIYASAQKNIGCAGITLVIVRDDLLHKSDPFCPAVLDYKLQADKGSMYNTPPTFGWYMASLVFKWLKEQGGLKGVAAVNGRKAKKLYGMIDKSGFYQNTVDTAWRSKMNIPFTLADTSLESHFLADAEQAGFLYLQGHKAVGGMRASLYNAIPEQQVDALVNFMGEFERRYG